MKTMSEGHRISRIGWLRAAVLGANDGIISTSSLLIGVAAAQTSHSGIIIAGTAGLIAGAMSMAAGEYISVSSQADLEKAESKQERLELETNADYEMEELAHIYVKRGLDYPLAKQVAEQLTAHDALAAHLRDELGITETLRAKPLQAAISSGLSFSLGAFLPLMVAILFPVNQLIMAVSILAIIFLALLGIISARLGRSSSLVAASRVMLWGALAMLVSAGIGRLLGVVV